MTHAVKFSSPTTTVAERVKDLRQRRGWTAAELALRCADKGLDGFNRSVLANIESGRRKYVTVDELVALAYVLDVAPIHLLVPVEVDQTVDEHFYGVCPDVFLPVPEARAWVRGSHAPATVDPRVYYSEVPLDEWKPPQLTSEQVVERGEELDVYRDIVVQASPPGHQAKARQVLAEGAFEKNNQGGTDA